MSGEKPVNIHEKSVNIHEKSVNIHELIGNEEIPDNLKCVKCRLVLQDACQVPCGCRFCRVCITDLMGSGSEFCPGVSEDCGKSILAQFAADFRANKSISRLPVKCPRDGCEHKCRLAEIEEHMRVCGRKSAACPFQEWGCQQDKLAAEEMSGHFHQENRRHCEILIGMIADITREVEMLKRNDETNKMKIEMLKRSDESTKMEIEMLKHKLELKDGQIRTIMDQMEHVENENKSINDEIKSIKGGKADLTDQVRILSETIEGEIVERRESDERDFTAVIEHVDKEITAVTTLIGSNKDEVDTAMRSVGDDIQSINRDIKSINEDIECIKAQPQSMQVASTPAALGVAAGQVDARFEWTIDREVGKMLWDWGDAGSISVDFTGVAHPYRYQLTSWNGTNFIGSGELLIRLRMHCGPSDARLSWPFKGAVTITVANRSKREACHRITLQCQISRPRDNHHNHSEAFQFSHSSLIKAGLDLSRCVLITCQIVPFPRSSAGR